MRSAGSRSTSISSRYTTMSCCCQRVRQVVFMPLSPMRLSKGRAPRIVAALSLICDDRQASLRAAPRLVGEVVDRHRLDRAGRLEAEDAAVEVELGLERAPDRRGAPKAVLLALEQQVGDRQALGARGAVHGLGLARRHRLVLGALQQDERARQALGEVDRRALAIEVRALGPRADQRIEVARLELVGVARQRREVADAEVAG